jgi:oligosaccharide repeat unit polymerase
MCHTIFVLQYSIFIFNIEEGKSGNKKKMILLASLILLLDFLVGNRGQALFFIYMLVVVTAFYRRIAIKIVLSGLLALYSFGFIKSYREWLFYGDASFVSIENDWGHSVGLFGAAFYHLYMGLAFNFEMLNRYISSLNEFQYGYFTFINPLLSILPGKAYSLVDFQRDELGIYFHGELTATFFSVPYFDFGVFGVIFSFVFGYYAQKFYLVAKNGGRPEDVAIYAYFSLQLFVGVYAYTFDKLYVILDLILLLFLIPLLKGLLRR